MLKYAITCGYKKAKLRIVTENIKSLQKFRADVKESRRNAHLESTQYQNQIEDEFLERHKQNTRDRNFKDYCDFRGKIAEQSYLLHKRLEQMKIEHEETLQKMEKFIHQEEVKKMNRDRIKKILQYESSNYWLTPADLQNRLTNQSVFPAYLGTTEYYHKLHAEAIAYQNLDFDMLGKISNNQAHTAQKNKLLIPLYKQILVLIRELKTNQYQKLLNQFQIRQRQYEVIYNSDQNVKAEKLKQLQEEYRANLKTLLNQYHEENSGRQFLMERLRLWVKLLKKWSEYAEVLNLTTMEIRKKMEEQHLEKFIEVEKRKLKKEIKVQRSSKFVDPIEEDTEEDEISLEQFIKKNTSGNDAMAKAGIEESSTSNLELEMLLQEQQSIFDEMSQQVSEEKNTLAKQTKMSEQLLKDMEAAEKEKIIAQNIDELNVDDSYLSFNETTTSIELLKEKYKQDEEMLKLLNLTGEIMIQYPRLFKRVWDQQII